MTARRFARAAFRNSNAPSNRASSIGFRVALSPSGDSILGLAFLEAMGSLLSRVDIGGTEVTDQFQSGEGDTQSGWLNGQVSFLEVNVWLVAE